MNHLSKVALAGLVGASALVGCKKADGPATGTDKPSKENAEEATYSEIHTCRGLNSCKGLGGCEMTAALIQEYAAKVHMDPAKAGAPHSCAGLNECKGLGGCHVDQARLDELKAKLADK